MKVRSTFNNNQIYSKRVRSMEKIKPSSKLNLSIMDEKLSLLNSDIEDLYKKYVEKKKLRRRKEKSEQSLASRINFLIDEERKIRNQIENKIIKNQRCPKNRSVKALRTPEIVTNSGTIRYNTIESNDDSSPINRKKKITNFKYVKKKITNYNNKDKDYESYLKKKQFAEMIKKNGLNDITLSSIQNNSSMDNNNNITIGNRSNVTNNVCIIINNSDKSNSKDNIYNKNFNFHDISFAEKDNNLNIDFKINDSININGSNKMKQNILINDSSDKKANENENQLNNEINYFNINLASKLNEENMQTICQTYHQKEEISLNNPKKKNLYINDLTNIKDHKNYLSEYFDNNLKTPSFKQKINKENIKIKNKSVKEVLNIKQRKLENEKEFNINKSKEKKRDVENKNMNNNLESNNKITKKINHRCFSKPDNGINKSKDKMIKSFNQNNLQTNLNPNKSQIINKMIYLKNKISKEEDNNYNDLSIDSDEIILSDERVNISKKIKQNKTKKKNNFIINNNFNNKNKELTKEEKLHAEYDSTPNLLGTSNLTFNQSIEKKRKLLGIPLNIKENLIKRNENTSKAMKNTYKSKEKEPKSREKETKLNIKEKENKVSKNNNKKENTQKTKNKQKVLKRNAQNHNKTSKTNDNKNNNKKNINLNNINSPFKEITNENEPYYTYKYPDVYNNLFTSNQKNNVSGNKENNGVASTSSLASLFSTQTNKSNKTNKTLLRNNNNANYDNNTKSNNNLANVNKLKKNMEIIVPSKSNNKIIIKKNENKNYLNTIRLIKKRDKINNKEKENIYQSEEKIENNTNIYKADYKVNKNENHTKYYENELKPKKGLEVIRRINKKIENYKKNGPQVYKISKRHKKNLEINNHINNERSNTNKFHSYRRLSEIQKRPKYSFTNNNTNNTHNNIGVNKSKSNRSLPKFDKYYKSFKF